MTRRHLLTAPAATFAQNPPPPGIGIIGTGNRASAHFRAYPQLSEARIVALSDLESERMETYNKTLPRRAATYTDWRELLKDPQVGIVVITAPNFLHHDMAIAALRAGKHVLLEKPIAITYTLARRIQKEAESSGRILAVGMQRRYWAMDAHIQQLVDGNLIGPVRFIQVSEYRGDWSPRGWQYTDPATGGKPTGGFSGNWPGPRNWNSPCTPSARSPSSSSHH
ncbi:MAG: Gfo/Idh/MocA family oxidoreductase [Acidimicrobiia bacterium]|nr:Gfo/Idh/MocA family oxidoreductase [Acidimicrobiia bacterium]